MGNHRHQRANTPNRYLNKHAGASEAPSYKRNEARAFVWTLRYEQCVYVCVWVCVSVCVCI